MKTQFVETNSRKSTVKEMHWADKIVKTVGGYMGFESIQDYKTWKNQK